MAGGRIHASRDNRADRLREVLVNPESEHAAVFSQEQKQELLYHVSY